MHFSLSIKKVKLWWQSTNFKIFESNGFIICLMPWRTEIQVFIVLRLLLLTIQSRSYYFSGTVLCIHWWIHEMICHSFLSSMSFLKTHILVSRLSVYLKRLNLNLKRFWVYWKWKAFNISWKSLKWTLPVPSYAPLKIL